MSAKTWDKDFRKDAIRASIQKMKPEEREDPFQTDESFCIPVRETPVPFWTPGKVSLIFLLIGFVFLGLGAVIVSYAEKRVDHLQPVLIALGVACSLSGFLKFFVPAKGDRLIISRMIGERARRKIESFDRKASISAELGESGVEGQNISVDGDDHVLVFFDQARKRLLIEGIGARYQICAVDVTHFSEFQFMNYLGAAISCRINESTELNIAIDRVSILFEILRQIPIFWFLRKRIKNQVFVMCEETLGLSETIKLSADDIAE
ncbi:MAG: hypothetical protein P8M30_10420 [Planctomycetaceae bacterium]|nr:hypothetical protein [bacterium]MDG2389720.1 hypothetical protein [Planctomycetaceae bacterium]